MPENESLDFREPGARRWDIVWQKVREGESREKTADLMNRRLHAALRKAFEQLEEHGAPFGVLLANRDRPERLRPLVRKSEGHDYAEVFSHVAAANPGMAREALLAAFVGAILERIEGGIVRKVVPSDRWPSIPQARAFLREARRQMDPEVQRIARKLAEDPGWRPRVSPKRGSKADPTAEMLQMSLVPLVKRR